MGAHDLNDFASNRYYDRLFDLPAVKILPGEYYVTTGHELIVTVLGSCVACCLRDAERPIGGMNHFMLPEAGDHGSTGASGRYGVNAMELLINKMLRKGARRASLVAKIFGGAKVLRAVDRSDVGGVNAEFIRSFLKAEGIPILAHDLKGHYARKVYYFPADNRVRVKKIKHAHNDTITRREREYRETISHESIDGEIELFAFNRPTDRPLASARPEKA